MVNRIKVFKNELKEDFIYLFFTFYPYSLLYTEVMYFFRRYLATSKPNVSSNFVLHFLFRVRGGESDFIPLRNTAKNSLSNTNKI